MHLFETTIDLGERQPFQNIIAYEQDWKFTLIKINSSLIAQTCFLTFGVFFPAFLQESFVNRQPAIVAFEVLRLCRNYARIRAHNCLIYFYKKSLETELLHC